ncbi:hypothetical protein PFICI_10255 [Pestalotiopsis fici W106-1]|uniref:BHLH domain-containing protein n=1 Tax=Pestalotiopsis fici (strain W106-1 / CGMCC3.15140) TaxID=1229662 RepID=W3WWD5_PESFW|nr:uncharacterized protein PFICI_10255 [Pestalotiopsis fici W106-1]ETS78193.1 hypothetical protein PFICI_10255 [Pestalotiopsis fici W106-1]
MASYFDGNNTYVPVTEGEPFTDPSWDFNPYNDSPSFTYDSTPLFSEDWKQIQQPQQQQQPESNELSIKEQPSQASITPPSTSDFLPPDVNGLPYPLQTQPAVPAMAMNTLTESQRRKLQSIAMPAHLQYQSPKSEPSPESASKSASMSPSDGGSKSNCRKRKSSVEDDDEDDDDLDGPHPVKKTAHNMIEKRYRTNLNDKIAALRDSVPSLRIMSKSSRGEDTTADREELHGLTPAHKLNKATVLSKATEYIRHLEKRNVRLADENSAMQQRIAAFEKLFLSGAMNGAISPIQQAPTPGQYPRDAVRMNRSPPMPTTSGPHAEPQGMMTVPEDMKRILAAQMAVGQPYPVPQQPFRRPDPAMVRQQQIHQQQQQMQAGAWQNTAPYFGKLMVGSLAGLMILEAVRENEKSDDRSTARGLSSLPFNLLGSLISSLNIDFMGYHLDAGEILTSLKYVLVLCCLWWAIIPSLFRKSPPKPKTSTQGPSSLGAAPSPASPIHVRRQAWLTAIQNVWIPRHNFFLEAAALGLKTMKLSLRNLIGVSGYQMLTGLSEEQEAARVKAWSIALDAQLAGGDVEINKSRLTLTLVASGTLPDTPLRLMLKALHIRILLWEVGLTGVQLGIFNTIASKMARSKWNEARDLHRLSKQLRRGGNEQYEDDLPDHLTILLEQDADEVFNQSVVQRAHNLAWNRPTDLDAIGVTDGMDAVVEDTAIRSPMDAVAAWWSTLTLQSALTNSLLVRDDEDGEITQNVEDGIMLALRVAPVGSIAQNRALVARAVLFNEKRGANIAAVIQAIGPYTASQDCCGGHDDEETAPDTPNIDIPDSISSQAEVYMSLQCAKAIAHLQRYAPPEEPTSVYPIIENEIDVTNELSLLGYTAAFTLMNRLAGHEIAAETCSRALEKLSGNLRIWIGKDSWLDSEVKQEMVERCLAVTRGMVGMDIDTDTGYGSMSDSEVDHDAGFSSDSEQFSVSSASDS